MDMSVNMWMLVLFAYLSITDVYTGEVNVALKSSCITSSTYPGFPCENAIDGDESTEVWLVLVNASLVPGEEGMYNAFVISDAKCILDYGDGNRCDVLNSSCSSSTNTQAYYTTKHVYTTPGEFNVTIFCENDIGNTSDHGIMSIQYPIEGLTISTTDSRLVALEKKDGSIIGEVQFSYQNGTSAEADCVIPGGGDCSNTTALNSDSKNGSISFVPSYFLTLGEYTLTLRLENKVSHLVINVSLILAEKIMGLTLDIPDVVLVNSTILAHANVTSGTSVEFVSLTGDSGHNRRYLCSDHNHIGSFSCQFFYLGQATFAVRAINVLGEAVVTETVTVLTPVVGFSATTSSTIPRADLELKTSSVLAEHMGSLIVLITSNGKFFHNTTIKPKAAGETYSIYQNLSKGNRTFNISLSSVVSQEKLFLSVALWNKVEGPSPKIWLSCHLNCFEKKNAAFSIQYASACSNCSRPDLAESMYDWKLYQRLDNRAKENLVPDFKLLTNTGVKIPALSILPQRLQVDYTYRLELQISNISAFPEGVTFSEIFRINYPPYNGSCSVFPLEGRSVLDPFTVSCSGWVDEDVRTFRSPQDNGDSLTYQFLLSGEDGDESLIYSGENTTSPPTVLNVGKEEDDYKRIIIFRVFDAYYGMAESSMEVTVLSPVEKATEVQTLASVSSLLAEFLSKVNDAVKKGNVQQSSRLIESVVSVIQTLRLPGDDTLIPVVPDSWLSLQPADVGLENKRAVPWTDLWEELITPPDTELKGRLIQVTSAYIDIMVRLVNKTAGNYTLDNVFFMSTALGHLARKSQFVGDNSLVEAVDSITQITTPIEEFFREDKDLFRAKEVLTSVMSALDKMIGVILPEFPVSSVGVEDLATVFHKTKLKQSYESEENQLLGNEAKEGADLQDEERAFFWTRTVIRQQYENKKKRELAKSVINRILRPVDKVIAVAERLLVVGQDPMEFSKPRLTASVQKLTMKDYMTRTIHGGGASLTLKNVTDFGGDNIAVLVKSIVFTKTPYVWDEDGESSAITSSSVTLSLTASEPHGLDSFINYETKLKLGVPNPEPIQSTTVTPQFIPLDRDEMLYHKLELRATDDTIIIFLTSTIRYVKYDVYFRSGEFPKATDFDYKTSIPSTHTEYGLPKLKVMCPGGSLPTSGPVFVALKPYQLQESTGRQKRDTLSFQLAANQSTIHSDYGFGVATVGCRDWNDDKSNWNSDICTVSEDSTENQTVCSCSNMLTQPLTLATSFVVPVNKIDFSTVFAEIDLHNNASVLATILSLVIVYILLAVWARHKDCSDFLKWGATPLLDNIPINEYVYIVTVRTGMRPGAGTKSKVGITLTGTEHESMNRLLYDGIRDEFPTRSVLNFIMVEPYPLGELDYIRVWHDDSGAGDAASWFLENITIEDIQTDIRYTCMCDRWLAVDKDDGKIERIVPVSGKSDLLKFSHLFKRNIRQNVTDTYLWLSVLMRPTQSHFTRLQRLSCCLSLLFLTMITSAMFYKSEENIVRPTVVIFGSLRFSLQQLYVSFISILIVTPVNLLLVLFFKKTKPDDGRKPSILDRKCFSRCFPGAAKRAKLADVMITRKTYDANERMLPHYFIYLHWAILIASIAVSASFLFLYSVEWGKAKSEEWLTSFLLSFFESLILMDPIKVVLITVFLSVVFRNTDKLDRSFDKKKLKTQKRCTVNSDEIEIPHGKGKPLNEYSVKKSKKIRRDESTAFGIAKEVTTYIAFLAILFTIGYSNRDSRSFAMKQNVHNALVRRQSLKQIGLENIGSREQFFCWVNETAFPFLFAENYYEGSKKHWRERYYVKDLQNYRVGPPRFRQLRSEAGKSCDIPQFGKMPCELAYSIVGEEARDFCIGWKAPPCPDREPVDYLTSAAWKFTSSLDIWGLTIWGVYNTYGGGGYISVFDVNYQVSSAMLDEEFKHLWLDTLTRAVTLEFILYNPNVNMFVFVSLLVEFPETGGATPKAFVLPFRAYHHTGALGMYILINQVLLLLFIVFATIKLTLTIKKLGLLFFFDPWNALDFACLVTSYVCIGMFFIKENMVQMALEKFNDNPKNFVNFEHITIWDELLVCFNGLVCFFSTIRLIKILNYHKRISSISYVLRRASGHLISFSIIFAIVFIGFTILGYLVFGRVLPSYNGMLTTAATLFTAMIGKSPFDEMRRREPILAQVYFALYIFFTVFILLTMFMSILKKAIDEVGLQKEDLAGASRYQVFDILLTKFKEIFGISTTKPSSVDIPTIIVTQELASSAADEMPNDTDCDLKVEIDVTRLIP